MGINACVMSRLSHISTCDIYEAWSKTLSFSCLVIEGRAEDRPSLPWGRAEESG